MAGLPWTRLYVDFPTGTKAISLGIILDNPWAWAHVVRLWCYAARHQQDGMFEGPAAVATIEVAAGWAGSRGVLVDALSLQHIRLLDHTDRGFYIHDWHEHGGAHVEKLKKDRRRKREERSAKRPRKVHGRSKERRLISEPPSLSPSPSQMLTVFTPELSNSAPSFPSLGVLRGDKE